MCLQAELARYTELTLLFTNLGTDQLYTDPLLQNLEHNKIRTGPTQNWEIKCRNIKFTMTRVLHFEMEAGQT